MEKGWGKEYKTLGRYNHAPSTCDVSRGNVDGKMHAVPACLAVSKVRVVAAAAAWADRFSMFSVSVFSQSLKHPDTRAIADELDGCHVSAFFII